MTDIRQAGFVSCRGAGQRRFDDAGGAGPVGLSAHPPVLLEYTRDEEVLRWELEPTASGTRLTLRHTVADKSWMSRVAAGWHICLDVAEHMLAGQPLGRIVADEAKLYGWEQLNAAYSAQLGIADAGWPEKAGSTPRGA